MTGWLHTIGSMTTSIGTKHVAAVRIYRQNIVKIIKKLTYGIHSDKTVQLAACGRFT